MSTTADHLASNRKGTARTKSTAKRVLNRTADAFRGQLKPVDGTTRPSFEGYRVAATIERRSVDEGTNGEHGPVENRRATAAVAKNGTFSIEGVGDNDTVTELRVYAPSGSEVHIESQVQDGNTRGVKIKPAAAVVVPGIAEPTTRSFLLRGFVVDKEALQPAPAGQTVSIWRTPKSGAATPVGTVVTGKGGLIELAVTVADGDHLEARFGPDAKDAERIPTPEEGHPSITAILPIYTAAAVEGEAPAAATDRECSCEEGPGRTPDATTLATDPTYSADLGGRCAQFTVPNRALEEFDLYSIVRTTDPALQPITLSDDPESDLLGRPTAALPAAPAAPAETTAVADVGPRVYRLAAERDRLERDVAMYRAEGVAEVIAPSADALAIVEEFRRRPSAALTEDAWREMTQRPFRTPISESTPVDWDDTPTINQAVSIAHGHLLHWRQTWRSDGYSLGDLLYSLPLAAGQKRRVAIVDWERTELASRGEQTHFDEALRNVGTHERELKEVVSGVVREGISGGSRAFSAGVGMGTGGAASGTVDMFNLGAVFGISGGAGYSDANSFQNSARMAAADSAQTLRELTMQSASATRGVRSTTVVSVGEEETARATTEVVANHNHCHAITVQYFEVLRHLRVDTDLVDVQECLFVPLTMKPFDPHKVLRWRKELAPAIVDLELSGAFDAIQRVATQWELSGAPLGRYADEQVRAISGELRIMLSVPVPPPPPDLTLQKMMIDNAAAAGVNAVQAAAAAMNAPPDWMKGVQTFLTMGGSDMARQTALSTSAAAADSIRRQADFQMAMLDRAPSERSRFDYFFTYVMPRFAPAFVDQLTLVVTDDNGMKRKIDGVDFTLVDSYVPGSPLRVTFNAPDVTGLTRSSIRSLTVRSELPLPTGCRAIAYGISADYATDGFEHRLVSQPRVVDDIDCGEFAFSDTNVNTVNLAKQLAGPGITVRCPVDAWEQRRPRLEDVRLAAALLDHLNDHLEQYHHVLWWSMNPNRRFMLLDGFVGPNGRSLASCVDNRLMAIVGNSLVLPVARGLNLDPTIRASGSSKQLDLLSKYRPTSAVLPYRISFPTRGVFAESVMGSCNSCEPIDDSTNWRWEESPIDDVPAPTADTLTRRSEPQGLTPTQPPAPIISQQAPLDVPDPTGLAALIGLLGSISFRDATGLAGSQANAAAALQQNVAAALEYGKEASKLAQAANLMRSKDQYFDSLDKAKQKGAITDEQYKDLTAARLKAMSTAGSTDDAEAAKAKLAVVQQAKSAGLIDDAAAKSAAASIVKAPVDPAHDAAATKIEQVPASKVKSVEVNRAGTHTVLTTEDPPATTTAPPVSNELPGGMGGGIGGTIGRMFEQMILGAAPPPKTARVTMTKPGGRTCCALGFSDAVDPGAVTGHEYAPWTGVNTDPTGYVYTSGAGIVDLGHARDMADMTRWVFDALQAGNTRLVLYEGEVNVLTPPADAADAITLAASITFVESWAHELSSWDAENFSAFSPEDLPSNIVGIELARRALTAGGSYEAAIDVALPAMLTSLGARSKAGTEAVITKLKTKPGTPGWYSPGVVPSLDRRNFDGSTWPAGMAYDAPVSLPWLTPAAFAPQFPRFTYSMFGTVNGTSGVTLATMATETEKLRKAWVAAHPGMDRP